MIKVVITDFKGVAQKQKPGVDVYSKLVFVCTLYSTSSSLSQSRCFTVDRSKDIELIKTVYSTTNEFYIMEG